MNVAISVDWLVAFTTEIIQRKKDSNLNVWMRSESSRLWEIWVPGEITPFIYAIAPFLGLSSTHMLLCYYKWYWHRAAATLCFSDFHSSSHNLELPNNLLLNSHATASMNSSVFTYWSLLTLFKLQCRRNLSITFSLAPSTTTFSVVLALLGSVDQKS